MWSRGLVACAVVLALVPAGGCTKKSCLDGGDCEATAPCGGLDFLCETPRTFAGTVATAPAELRLARGQGAAGDVLISNGVVTAVISAIDAPTDLAPTGGNLIDYGPVGGADDLTILYQLAGLLPDDAFAYTRLDVIDRSPDYVAVIARGHLDGRTDVEVATRYELRACDPGVRVRSELFNGSPDVQAFAVADTMHWGKRRVIPFAPAQGQGYVHPELELLELTALWKGFPYGAAASPAPDAPAYALVACDRDALSGVNDLEVSALGTEIAVVFPGDTLVHERFLVTGGDGAGGGGARGGSGPAAATGAVLSARTQLHGDGASIVATGRVLAEGLGFGGDARRASIVIVDRGDGRRVPATAVVPAEDGTFSIAVPSEPLGYEVWSFGRRLLRGDVPEDGALGDLTVPAPALVQLAVTSAGAPIDALVVVEPADDVTREEVTGTFHGRQQACAPWLGPPHGASPACNRVLVEPAGTEVEIPAGRYWIYASAGPASTIARTEVELAAGEITAVALALQPLALAPAGWLAADLHVHGQASFDSGLPDRDRVRSFLAAGVDVIAATDHDHVTDYGDAIDALGAGDRLMVMPGLETTPLIPFLDVPGEDLPRVVGHFNFWPLTPVPSAPRGGAPWDERLEPGALFDRLDPLIGADGVKMINHPWDEPTFGRDLGYLRAIGFDPREPVGGGANRTLLRTPGGGHANLDWDVMEVQNGAGADEWMKTRPLWFALLSAGFVVPGVAASDSHGLRDNQLGWGRTWVDVGTPLAQTTPAAFNRALKAGKTVAGSGIFLDVAVTEGGPPVRGLGLEPIVLRPASALAITVRAAPWIPVAYVRIIGSAGEVLRVDVTSTPADPFGTDGVTRLDTTIPLAQLVGASDDWLVIEAVVEPPPYADLDGDGVVDTGDNDANGTIDLLDVEDDEDTGPIGNPPDPIDPADPRFHMTRIVPESWPIGFTSPLLVDVGGDGWTPPGAP